jgi:hypothetical protein
VSVSLLHPTRKVTESLLHDLAMTAARNLAEFPFRDLALSQVELARCERHQPQQL